MPLRDHFRPPVSKRASWEGFHGMWPGEIIRQLRTTLPPGFVAEPRAHLGAFYEIDVSTYEADDVPPRSRAMDGDGVATLPWAAESVVAVETDLADEYEYAVRVYDAERERALVAAIEIVSPANKDRPEKRNAFIGKCAAMLRQGVAVSVVDLVTVRRFNLFSELMTFIGHDRLAMSGPPPTYAGSCRWVPRGEKNYLEAWSRPLVIGEPLPAIPLWLAADRVIPLDLEVSYEQACHDLWIT
jgi:hypothetical protein